MPRELAQLLVDEGVVAADDVERALARQREAGGALDSALLELGLVPDELLAGSLARAAELPAAPLSAYEVVDPRARRVFPSKVAERHGLAPFALDGRELSLVATYPIDLGLLDEISFMLSLHLQPHVGPEWRVRSLIQRLYGGPMSPRLARLAEALPPPSSRPAPFAPGRAVAAPPPAPVPQADRTAAPPLPPSDAATAEPPTSPDGPSAPPAEATPAPRPTAPPAFRGFARDDGEPLEPLAAALAQAIETFEVTWGDEPEPLPGEAPVAAEVPGSEGAPPSPAEVAAPPPRPIDRTAPPRWTLEQARAALADARTRDEIVVAVLRYARDFFRFAALFAVTRDAVAGHDALGPEEESRELARSVALYTSEPGVFRTAIETCSPHLGPVPREAGGNAMVLDGLLRGTPRTALVYPVLLRGRPVCILYADNGEAPVSARRLADLLLLLSGMGAAFERIIHARKRPAPPMADPPPGPVAPAAPEAEAGVAPEPLPPEATAEVPAPAPEPVVESVVAPDASLAEFEPPPPASEPPPPVGEPPPVAVVTVDRPAGPLAPTPSAAELVQASAPEPVVEPPPDDPSTVVAPIAPPEWRSEAAGGPRPPPEPERSTAPPPSPPESEPPIAPAPMAAARPEPDAMPEPRSPPAVVAAPLPEPAPSSEPPPSDGPGSEPAAVPRAATPAPEAFSVAAVVGAYLASPRASDERARLLALLVEHAAEAAPMLCDFLPGPLEVEPAALARTPVVEQGPVLAAVAALGPAAVRSLTNHLSDADPARRRAAVALLGLAGDAGSFPGVADRCFDPDPAVREAALEALGAHRRNPGMKVVCDRLRRALLSGLSDRSAAAARAIGALRDAESIPLLIQALEGSDGATAAASGDALGAITLQRHGTAARKWLLWWKENRGRRRAEWLFAGLTSEDREVRLAAADELRGAAASPVSYSADLPPREREEAARAWAGWWARSGHVL